MIILNNSMDSHTIVELLNNAIQNRASSNEIVPKGVKAKRIFWNNELKRWYGVDSTVYRSGERIKTSDDYIIVGNLPKRCYNMSRGSCSLRSEIFENLDSLHVKSSGLVSGLVDDSSYSKAMFSRDNNRIVLEKGKEIGESDSSERIERAVIDDDERERRKEESKALWERMMSEESNGEEEYDDD